MAGIPRSCAGRALCLAALLLCASAAAIDEPDTSKYKLDFSTELSVFPEPASDARQAGRSLSISALGKADFEWHGGITKLGISPFVRRDSADSQRSHADLRELEVRHRSGNFDWHGGISKVFWGTTESVHLVDIINQTDAVEGIDGEDKLGQPMLSVAWSSMHGVFTGFVLPRFRERTLPGVRGRLRPPLNYDRSRTNYQSTRGKKHVDSAVRWNISGNGLDIGVAHFVGTAREPRFLLQADMPEATLLPVYDQIRQTSIDLSAVSGGWIWKFEGLHQRNPVRSYNAAVGGFEYTLPNNETSSPEVGLLSELAWDSRGSSSPSPFQRDIFFGVRVSLNDVAGSEMLAGIMQDLRHSGRFISIDASRRIGGDARLALKLRLIHSTSEVDPLSLVSHDDHLLLEYKQHF